MVFLIICTSYLNFSLALILFEIRILLRLVCQSILLHYNNNKKMNCKQNTQSTTKKTHQSCHNSHLPNPVQPPLVSHKRLWPLRSWTQDGSDQTSGLLSCALRETTAVEVCELNGQPSLGSPFVWGNTYTNFAAERHIKKWSFTAAVSGFNVVAHPCLLYLLWGPLLRHRRADSQLIYICQLFILSFFFFFQHVSVWECSGKKTWGKGLLKWRVTRWWCFCSPIDSF